jgi:hypothetical protein
MKDTAILKLNKFQYATASEENTTRPAAVELT